MSTVASRRVLDRDAIVAATDLPMLADAILGPRSGSPASPTWPCPADDHDPAAPFPPRVSAFTTHRGAQRWTCQNCGADGSAVDLVMLSQGLAFRDALEFMARRAGIEQPTALRTAHEDVPAGRTDVIPRTSIDAWVRHASRLLWQPYGEATLRWLTTTRCLTKDVLELHRVGVTAVTPQDDLPVEVAVSGPRAATQAVVLPVVSRGRAVYAQLRLVEPPAGTSPYISARFTGAHPRIGLYRPPQRLHEEILVTEGIIDALSANAAGYRAAAVLAPGIADAASALYLSRLAGPLVLAFDPDPSGQTASDRLASHLWAHGRRPAVIAELGQDLNDALAASADWQRRLTSHVRNAVAHGPSDRVPEI